MSNAVSTENQSPENPPNGNGYRVVRLEASNVKRLKAITIEPRPGDGVVIVGGNNGEGKSSTLDAIMYALGGKELVAKDPIRHGQKKAHVTVDLGDYIATRRFSPTGQTLELKTKEGLNVPGPQTFLDGLVGLLNFDPLQFSRLYPRQRTQALESLVKLDVDLDDLAAKRKALFDQRTDANRRHRDYEGELRQTPEPEASLPKERIDVSELVNQRRGIDAQIKSNNEKRNRAAQERLLAEEKVERIQHIQRNIKRLEEELAQLSKELDAQNATVRQLDDEVSTLVDPDTSQIDAQISQASDLNTKIDRAAQYRERLTKCTQLGKQVDSLSEQIEAIDQQREDALARAQFPVPGLSFADGDVSYNGILFDQLSSSEQLRVSLGMAMAMNPRLRVIRIMDGSLLDETSMGIVREMAQSKGYQVWIEVVGNRSDATVIIEDGEVVGAEEAEERELAHA